MRLLRRFFTQTSQNRRYLVQTYLLMVFIKVALSVFPFQRLYVFLMDMVKNTTRKQPDRYELRRAIESVEICSRHTPFQATCLIKALTGQVLLLRSGFASELRIGVARSEGQPFEAHAWVIHDQDVVIGNRTDLNRYRTFSGMMEKLQ